MIRQSRKTVLAFLLAISLGIVPLAVDSAQAAFPAGTTAYWALDDAQQVAPGTYVEEIIPANGVCAPGDAGALGDAGCPTFLSPGQVGDAQTFVGADNSDGIDVATDPIPGVAADAPVSVALWIQRDTTTGAQLSQNEVAIGQDDTIGGSLTPVHWWIGLSTVGDTAQGSPQNVATFLLSDSGAVGPVDNSLAVMGTTDLADGAWHYLVGVKEASGELRLYVDGALVDTETPLANPYTIGFDSTEPINIGYMDFRNENLFNFTGSIDEVAIFSKALTDQEVADLYALGQAGDSLRDATVPVAVDDSYSTTVDTPINEAAPGVLLNDSPNTTAVLGTNVVSGILALAADGSFTYTPNAGFTGTDTFTYTANDGITDSNIATVTITVSAAPVNPPVNPPVSGGGGGGGGGCFILTAGE